VHQILNMPHVIGFLRAKICHRKSDRVGQIGGCNFGATAEQRLIWCRIVQTATIGDMDSIKNRLNAGRLRSSFRIAKRAQIATPPCLRPGSVAI